MQRRTVIANLAIMTVGLRATPAVAWPLVSAEEERREGRAAPPSIAVIQPDSGKPISGPVAIQLAFYTRPDATIDTSTFKATYGFLGLNITERLLKHAKLTPKGITAEDVSIPTGQHRITLSVADTMKRVARRTFEVTVV